MKRFLQLLTSLLVLQLFIPGGFLQAQSNILLYNEDFETGGFSFSLNTAGVGSGTGNNQWIINSSYTGGSGYPATTDQTNTTAGSITLPNNNYLHIHDINAAPAVSNANYSRGSASDRFAIFDPGICTKSMTNVRISFFWMGEGSASDYVELYYSADGGAWTQVGPNQFNNQTLWNQTIVSDPAFNNVGNLRFGFRWVNTTGATPNTISFGVDDIFVLGDYATGSSPVDIIVSSLPDSACQGDNIILSFQLSDTLCDGQYLLEMLDQSGNRATNPWVFNINYPRTTSAVLINIPTSVPTDTCYTFRLNRQTPLPAITGTVSACFNLVACPNTITPEQPAVTIGSELPGGPGVCVGSVIDVPFWSTGTFQPGNVYTAELSDDLGQFTNPSTIGTFTSSDTYDPNVVPNPGQVAGLIPPAVDGCNYYIRVVSSNPATVGTVWGPFCIKNCDIETNDMQDLQFCIGQTFGDSARMPYNINVNASNSYAPGNDFELEILDMMTFASLNIGDLGRITSTISDTMDVIVPPEPILAAAPYNLAPGMYYARVVANSANDPTNALGSVIRMSIGAPEETGPTLFATPDTFCRGVTSTVLFYILGGDPNSTYTMTLLQNGQSFEYVPPGQVLGLNIPPNWPAGELIYRVQEENYGCLGPLVNDTLFNLQPPTGNVVGDRNVCFGDTATFTSAPFIPNTAYGWSLNPPNGGSIISQGSNQVGIVFDSISGPVTVSLDYATNQCGISSGTFNMNVRELPTADSGRDTAFCAGGNVEIGGNPAASGGTFPYAYSWEPPTGLSNPTNSNPSASPTDTTTYVLTVSDSWGCEGMDTVNVILAQPPVVDLGPQDTLLCEGGQITLDATTTGAILYLWNNGETTPAIEVDTTGMYYVDVFDILNCQGSDTILVDIRQPLIFDLGADTSICGSEYTLRVDAPGADFRWSTGSTIDSITIEETGSYWVEVTNECESKSDSIFVILIDDERKYMLPNVFTPNGDGTNDLFTTETGIPLDDFSIEIYDRWGRRMFESIDPFFEWNGTDLSGKQAPAGVYYLILKGYNCEGEYVEVPENVSLVR